MANAKLCVSTFLTTKNRMKTMTGGKFIRHFVAVSGNRSNCGILNINRLTLSKSQAYSSSSSLISHVNGEYLVKGPYPDITIPKQSFTEFLFSELDKHKDSVVMVDNSTGRFITSAAIKESAIKVASALTKLGYKKGDIILIFSGNCIEYSILMMACGAIGAILSTANPTFKKDELLRQLKNSQPRAVVTMSNMVPTVKQTVNSDKEVSDSVRNIFTIDDRVDGCIPFSSLMEDDGTQFPENIDINLREDVIFLSYSSGTTGLPKGVELTHENLVSNIIQMTRGPMKHINPEADCLLGMMPFYHIYGSVILLLNSLCIGSKLVLLQKFEPKTFLTAIQNHKISYLGLIPPNLLFLAQSHLLEQFDLSSVNTILSAGAPLGEKLTQEVVNRLDCSIVQGYGLTETSSGTHFDSKPARHGTVGQLEPNTIAKVIEVGTVKSLGPGGTGEIVMKGPQVLEVGTGKSLGPGCTGEIVMKGPQVMKGYHKNKKATDEMIKDGWIYTGDIGHFDTDGYFSITDRMKELIKYKGFQIAPVELEALLYTHPAIQDAAVIGVPGEGEVGEIPRAFVVLKPNFILTEKEVVKFVEEHVAPYKRLRGGVCMVDSIPKTDSGKILKRQLRDKNV